MPKAREWLDHIAGIWAKTAHLEHRHQHGWQNCPTCTKRMSAGAHDHRNGIDECAACATRPTPRCGNPTCAICG